MIFSASPSSSSSDTIAEVFSPSASVALVAAAMAASIFSGAAAAGSLVFSSVKETGDGDGVGVKSFSEMITGSSSNAIVCSAFIAYYAL